MKRKKGKKCGAQTGESLGGCAFLILSCLLIFSPACSTVSSVFAVDKAAEGGGGTIQNPFGNSAQEGKSNDEMIFRTKKGDRSVEVSMPHGGSEISDLTLPVAPAFADTESRPSSGESEIDDSYRDRKPSMADREITATLPTTLYEHEAARTSLEQDMQLMHAGEPPQRDRSYLAAMDRIKQLFKKGRFEAALIETDDLLRDYQTDPKIYEMRGTLLDRMGKFDLAIKSWRQALRFNPKNEGLRRFIEKREQTRGIASQ